MSTAQPDPAVPDDARTFVPFSVPVAHLPGELCNGDEMSRAEFHARYERTADDFKAELIDGEVCVGLPVSLGHGVPDQLVNVLFGFYSWKTPGVQCAPNTTIFLGPNDEAQPDGMMRILPECGGQSRTEQVKEREYVAGAPELVIEIAYSSRAMDLHKKRHVYQRSGVLEYLVLCVEEKELRWFDLALDATHAPDADGVMRLKAFPGLWIHVAAICQLNFGLAIQTLEAGLASPEHAAFVEHLAQEKVRIAATKAQA